MGSHLAPKAKVQVNHGLTWTFFVAGAGFEPATSGLTQRLRDYIGLGSEATDSLGVVRDSPSLPDLTIPEWCREDPTVSGQ
ncbi:hypothetical protein GCM10022263_28070 [Nocardioides daeguensis]|uniref:Uncharacterized protein n=1 Tax=Nocardioides daeguensis TaxID=908359 RepID=A0ABP6VQ19_9ACTN